MATDGEPDSAAARGRTSTGPAGDPAVVREGVTRLDSTLAAASARIELRFGREDIPPGSGDHHPGPVEQLIGSAARLAWENVVPEKFRAWWRDLDGSVVYAGFVEPAAGRYQISNGTYTQMRTGGRYYTGSPGQPRQEGRQDASPARYRNDPLTWLRLLRGVTEARHAGEETLHGTPCRKVILGKILREMRPASSEAAVSEEDDNPAEFTAWIDEHHVRQIQTDVFFSGNRSIGTRTLELWDFGVPVDSLDWTRFPGRPWPLGPPLPEARPASRTVL